MNIVIRKAEKDQLGDIAKLENICFCDPWSEQMFNSFIDSNTGVLYAAFADEKLCGYMCLYIVDGEENDVCGDCELANIAIDPNFRRTGLAKRLMKQMYTVAEERYCSSVFLEVRSSNLPAVELYKSEGFEIYGTRKNYYSAPREDALLMKKDLL